MLALRKSVNCAGKWTASDVFFFYWGYPKTVKCPGLNSQIFYKQLHKRQSQKKKIHSISQKGLASDLITFRCPIPFLNATNLYLLAARDSSWRLWNKLKTIKWLTSRYPVCGICVRRVDWREVWLAQLLGLVKHMYFHGLLHAFAHNQYTLLAHF